MVTERWNEADWLESISPEQMLAHLGRRASERKKRLFACACLRRIWPFLGDDRLHAAVELAERYADGQADARQMQRALLLVSLLREERASAEKKQSTWAARAARAAAQAVEALLPVKGPILETPRDVRDPPDVVSATRIARTAARADEALREEQPGASNPSGESSLRLASLDAVDLLHEIFGNPFRSMTVDPAWLAAEEGIVAKRREPSTTEIVSMICPGWLTLWPGLAAPTPTSYRTVACPEAMCAAAGSSTPCWDCTEREQKFSEDGCQPKRFRCSLSPRPADFFVDRRRPCLLK